MGDSFNRKAFGETLRRLRRKQPFSLKGLADALDCSTSHLSKLENGTDGPAVPSDHFIEDICNALDVSNDDARLLYSHVGREQPKEGHVEAITRTVQRTLRGKEIDGRAADDLIVDMKAFLSAWRRNRTARTQRVRKGIILAAGWQPRLLALDQFVRTLVPAIREAVNAQLSEVLLVVSPNARKLPKLDRASIKVSVVIQKEPHGLGSALLEVKNRISSEPFALVLADEIDKKGTALRELMNAYDQIRRPLVAVDSPDEFDVSSLPGNFGFAMLGEQPDNKLKNVFTLLSELVEKPGTPLPHGSQRIAGRYILTPEIFDALLTIPDRDLTAAINQLWRTPTSVSAYHLPHALRSIAPYQHLMDVMDEYEGEYRRKR